MLKAYLLKGGPLDGKIMELSQPFTKLIKKDGMQGLYKTPYPPDTYKLISRLDWFTVPE